MMTFADFMLDDTLLDALDRIEFKAPTAVQQAAIPPVLEGKDVLVCAATGTGKTAAFVLPLLQLLLDKPHRTARPQVLILTPTRELVFQIHHVIQQLAGHHPVNTALVTGGISAGKQTAFATQDCDIIIATPGRLLNLVADESIRLSDIQHVVIDEADRMLDMGQGPDVLALLATITTDFQVCLFSATLAGSGVEIFAEELLHDAEIIQLHAANEKSEKVSQQVYFADNKEHKQALLLTVLNDDGCHSALVFCNKRERAEALAAWLQSRNISAQVLHGDFSQAVRRERIRKFRNRKLKVLVATDVAARGLDFTNITHVVNYDMPFKGQIYIHRIGRTGRGEQSGIAINLVEHHDLKNLDRIEHHLKTKLPVGRIKGLEAKSKMFKGKMKKKKKKAPYIAKKDRVPSTS